MDMNRRIFLILITLIFATSIFLYVMAMPLNLTESEKIEIYSLVVHHIYSHNSFSPDIKWPVIFIDPMARNMDVISGTTSEGQPIPAELIESLKDLPAKKIVFANRSEAIGPMSEGGRVREGGAFITLGPIRSLGIYRVEVKASHYVGNVGASGWKYMIIKNPLSGQWEIAEAGMIWIS